ncbi:uncharacterized protein LOC108474608 [Gossypium arboreum]|uniref:uncharacterized protein LOC108474608 n=1 Tax=Gossypium arboreum TaxID=29729 RepID=UPI0008190A29|nr:uncharacterized protein LOC108474608 [Gossypium arboreum]
MESTALSGRMARWQILLSEFNIVYVNQKAVKGNAITDFLASRILDGYEPLNFDFSNEDLVYVATTEEDTSEDHPWKLNFDGASNAIEYEACIMGICAAIEHKIKVLEVYGDSALVIYQLRGEWRPKVDQLSVNGRENMKPIQMSIYEAPAHCCSIDDEEERDDYPWYHDILRYVKSREYPDQASKNDKRTLRRLASDYVLDGEIFYKRRKDQMLLRCVDAVEAKKILEVHESVRGTHANEFTIARQIMRFRYYWSTMEGDCINYAKKCHK